MKLLARLVSSRGEKLDMTAAGRHVAVSPSAVGSLPAPFTTALELRAPDVSPCPFDKSTWRWLWDAEKWGKEMDLLT